MSDWRELFPEVIVNAGDAALGGMWGGNQVTDYEASRFQITGTVYGKYHVRILRYVDEIVEMKCNCEYSQKSPCKHMAAVLIQDETKRNLGKFWGGYELYSNEEEQEFQDFVSCVDKCCDDMRKAIKALPFNDNFADHKKKVANNYMRELADVLKAKIDKFGIWYLPARYVLYTFEKLESVYVDGPEYEKLKQLCMDKIREFASMRYTDQEEDVFAWIYKRINRYNKMHEALTFTDLFYEYFPEGQFLIPKVMMTLNYIEIEKHLAMEEKNGKDFTGVYVLPCLELMIEAGYSNQMQDELALQYLHIPSVREWYEENKDVAKRSVKRPIIETLRMLRTKA